MEKHVKDRLEEDLLQSAKARVEREELPQVVGRRDARKAMAIIRYADDFVVIHRDKDIVEKAKEVISDWLAEMGLEFKPSKTRIAHTIENLDGQAGFDFLGCEIRQYRDKTTKLGHKTIIKPSKDAAKRHLAKVGEVIERHEGMNQIALISKLNPLIKVWSRYHCTTVDGKTFEYLKHRMYEKL